jgi:hypothetical protein
MNDFCSFVMLCIPLGTTFELLPIFPLFFSALDGACSDFTFYILLGDLALVELNKEKLQAMAPLKTFLSLWKGKGCHRKKMKKDYIKLHIISPKLIRIPRSGYVIAVHILQSVRTGS